MDIAEKTLQLKQDFDDVYEAGKKAATVNELDYDEFWDNLQKKGTNIHYSYRFAFTGWNDKIFNPKYPIAVNHNNGISNMLFWNVEITNTKVPISVTNGSMAQAFSNAQSLKTIPSLEVNGVTNFSSAFLNCTALEELNLSGVIDINGFNVQWSTLLTHDSLMSIINALKDYSADTSGTEWIVTIGDTNKAKLTDTELDIAQNKGWQVN